MALNGFPEQFQCSLKWRPYQERILAALDHHVKDGHFHVVAAPGAGKTILGLEIIRRLNHPALILAPTTALRDQWIQRINHFHPNPSAVPDLISSDLQRPSLITATTYQAFYAGCRKEGINNLCSRLRASGIRTLCVDEAHHLRDQWWKFLNSFKSNYGRELFIISLTATPPYDASGVEWNRYMNFCGQIDAEISVPELVHAASLCPHQDYLYLVKPIPEEEKKVLKFRNLAESFLRDLSLNQEFVTAVGAACFYISSTTEGRNDVSDPAEISLACMIFLKHATGLVPKEFLQSSDLRSADLPPFTSAWAEVLLNELLFHQSRFADENPRLMEHLKLQLQGIGAIDHRRVVLRDTPRLTRMLRSSPSRLNAITSIVELESRELRSQLRLLILTDFIREGDFPNTAGIHKEFTKMGVVPVFEHLRRLKLFGVELGILTGRLVVIPNIACESLRQMAAARGMSEDAFAFAPLSHAPEFVEISTSGQQGYLSQMITELFCNGTINVLIGTNAFLGEGWDAPQLNTLIMASTICSHVFSNQARGRALRRNPDWPEKVSNIWHIGCLMPSTPDNALPSQDAAYPGDIEILRQRFLCFVGLNSQEGSIENGIERMGISHDEMLRNHENITANMCLRAVQRDKITTTWNSVLKDHSNQSSRTAGETLVPFKRLSTTPLFRILNQDRSFLGFIRQFLFKRRLQKICLSLIESLLESRKLDASPSAFTIRAGKLHLTCLLPHSTQKDQALFQSSLSQIFDPMFSPRYICVAGNGFYSVPECLGDHKDNAEIFSKAFRRHIQRHRLIYTRSEEGKLLLMKYKQLYLLHFHEFKVLSRVQWIES